jgi:hypothetical protein
MMATIGVAVAGCGMIGGVHVTALKEIPETRAVGAWSRSPERGQQFAAQHQIRGYRTYEELLADPTVDAVIITLPSGYHAEYGIRAAQAGKHVIVEKPIDVTEAKARSLIEACRKADRHLSVVFQNRYSASQKGEGWTPGARSSRRLHQGWRRPTTPSPAGTKAIDGGISQPKAIQHRPPVVRRAVWVGRTSTHGSR